MKAPSLLEQAKAERAVTISAEEVELALGWVRGEVTLGAVCRAKGIKQGSQVYLFLCRALAAYIRENPR